MRETAAQALGSAARGLSGSSLQVLVRHLAALVDQKEWGVRLAGLLGIKYVLAARLDQAGALLPAVLPAVLTGLKVCFWHVRSCTCEHALQYIEVLPNHTCRMDCCKQECGVLASDINDLQALSAPT